MDNHLKRVYLQEVGTQCDFALRAVVHVNHALHVLELRKSGQVDTQAAHQEVFRNLHSLFTHASNISRLLWPPRPPRKRGESNEAYQARRDRTVARGQTLRELLEIGNGEHPLKGRTLRDHLQHFDERLDDWTVTSRNVNIMQDYIGPPGSVVVGLDDSDRMRGFDPGSANLTFRGETYNVQTLVTAIDALKPIAERKEKELWRSLPP